MLMPKHDPRDPAFRKPPGAVSAGKRVTVKIMAPRTFEVRDAFLRVTRDSDYAETALPMRKTDSDDTLFDTFEAEIDTEGYTGLLFYHFSLRREGGQPYFYGKLTPTPENPEVTGGIYNASPVPPWQITVYEPQGTPAWFGEGITYGIFPDRFYRGEGVVPDRPLKDWDAVPDYKVSPDGIIRRDDCYGGNLAGIREKLPFLRSLGVTTLYLNPIFRAHSNHRYDTGDYERIDPLLGGEDDFRALCRDAHALGMRILLDGVFSHTGADSRYFNASGTYDSVGAAQSKDSPYYPWYRFKHWPDDYDCWWHVRSLPSVEETYPSYMDYILRDADAIVRRWTRAGADGWRLDVADELPDAFLETLREVVREENPDALILGEVWEDASNKVAYGCRRHYFEGRELDGVMNYPLRDAILRFLGGGDALDFRVAMEALRDHYPPMCFASLLNFLGTHDTARVLTLLGCENPPETEDGRAVYRLSPAEYERGKSLLRLATAILYAFSGSPMIFYGDEAGLEGFEDPFNRRGYPWGREDADIMAWYQLLGAVRSHTDALKRGGLRFVAALGEMLAFVRETDGETLLCAVNRGESPLPFTCDWRHPIAEPLLGGIRAEVADGKLSCTLPARSCAWLIGRDM
ncbi:MAG: glycoside hydrolase family 13 protein [Clostridiaceae bacterium]|nr:glycoside hydrolase family 13 protein [Clostridiaceae bacterium]